MGQWQTLAALEVLDSFGFTYVSTPGTTNVIAGGTYYLVAGTFTAGTLEHFTHVGGRLTYTGPTARLFSIDVSVSMTSSNNIITHWRVAQNGTTLADSEQQRKVSTGSDIGNCSVHGEAYLNPGDYIEVFCTSDVGQDAVSITAELMTLTVE